MTREICLAPHQLAALRAELARLHAAGIELPPTLAAVVREVEAASVVAAGPETDQIDQLRDRLTAFESAHPRLTGIANDLLMQLAAIGI
jgi:hypothetical protein